MIFKGLFFGVKKLIFLSFFLITLTIFSVVLFNGLDSGFTISCDNFCVSTFLIGFDFGLIIPCAILFCFVILSKTGFFNGVIDRSMAIELLTNNNVSNNNFI